jgi:hypothetical protein
MMHRVSTGLGILLLASLFPPGLTTAQEGLNTLLQGTYAFVGQHLCVQAPAGTVFGDNFQIQGEGFVLGGSQDGTVIFNGDGTGTASLREAHILLGGTPPLNGQNGPCTFTYTVGADMTFTQDFTCDSTITVGAGQNFTLTSTSHYTGHIGPGGRTLLVSRATPTVDEIDFHTPSAFSVQQVCSATGTLIKTPE